MNDFLGHLVGGDPVKLPRAQVKVNKRGRGKKRK